MTTLKEFMSSNRHIKNEVSPQMLCVRDSLTGDIIVANADASGNLTVSSVGGAGTQDISEAYFFDYSSDITVTTGGYTEIIASTSTAVTRINIFDSSGEIVELALGGSGSETRKMIIPAGGISTAVLIPSGSRISIKSLTDDISTGFLVVNLIS
jgi:hypothetical protein